jgi:hypothetical protein
VYPPGHSSAQSLCEALPSPEVLPEGQLVQELSELAPSSLENLPAGQKEQPCPKNHSPVKPSLFTPESLVKVILKCPVVDVQVPVTSSVLDPLRRASSMLDSHDIASVDDSQL